MPPADAEDEGLAEELDRDVAAAGAEGAAQADLGAALEDGDDHHVGDPDPADQEGDRAEAEEERGEGAFGGGLGLEHVGGSADRDFFRPPGIGGARQQRRRGAHLGFALPRPHVDLRRAAVGAEEARRGRVADQRGAVEFGDQRQRFEDADDGEEAARDVDLVETAGAGNAEALRRFRPQARPPDSARSPGR